MAPMSDGNTSKFTGRIKPYTPPVTPLSPVEPLGKLNGSSVTIPVDDAQKAANELKWGKQPVLGTGLTSGPGVLARLWNGVRKTAGKAGNLTPYLSNIANAFTHAPSPRIPTLHNYTSLQKVNLSDERDQANRGYMSSAKATERNLPSNEAEAVKAYSRGQLANNLSSINERESNAGISNAQAQMDQRTGELNVGEWNDYKEGLTARDIADKRERSANIANAGDKMVLIENEKQKAAVDLQKTQITSGLFGTSGVYNRQRALWKKAGYADPLNKNYEDIDNNGELIKKKYGGMMKPVPTRKLI